MTHVFRHVVDRSALSSRALRPPGQLRISPVDSFEHIGHLRRRDRNDAFRRRGPDELATVEPLRIERNPKAIVPKDLHQIASAAPKNVEIAGSSKSESRTRQRRSELAPPSPRRRSGRARNRAPPSERAQQLPPRSARARSQKPRLLSALPAASDKQGSCGHPRTAQRPPRPRVAPRFPPESAHAPRRSFPVINVIRLMLCS
jgi:hypothetical protein